MVSGAWFLKWNVLFILEKLGSDEGSEWRSIKLNCTQLTNGKIIVTLYAIYP